MKICIIGAGFTGLSAAYYLSRSGHSVAVLEKESLPGGLAVGFKDSDWSWELEKHYHHLFTSDWSIRNLAREVGHDIDFAKPKTSTLLGGHISQLDSPLSLLKFADLSILDRLRTAFGLAILKFNPIWQPFEWFTAEKYIKLVMGHASWKKLWQPLFKGKFGHFTQSISAAWFWARIYKRSAALGYPKGGFQALARSIETAAKRYGAKFSYNISVDNLTKLSQKYDRVICTLPTPLFSKLSGINYPKLSGIGAVNLVLSLKNKFLIDDTYWLNINDAGFPFLAVVEHTNFISSAHYGKDHLLYIGNYLPSDHPYFNYSDKELLNEFLPHLQKINPNFSKSHVKKSWIWKAPFAQPVVTPHYSHLLPSLHTTIPHVYLANIQQVYPWDRGTNYAVELGNRVAKLCLKK